MAGGVYYCKSFFNTWNKLPLMITLPLNVSIGILCFIIPAYILKCSELMELILIFTKRKKQDRTV